MLFNFQLQGGATLYLDGPCPAASISPSRCSNGGGTILGCACMFCSSVAAHFAFAVSVLFACAPSCVCWTVVRDPTTSSHHPDHPPNQRPVCSKFGNREIKATTGCSQALASSPTLCISRMPIVLAGNRSIVMQFRSPNQRGSVLLQRNFITLIDFLELIPSVSTETAS